MPYCPECKFEYRPDINKCPDCDAWLVESLDEQRDSVNHDHGFTNQRRKSGPLYSDDIKKIMKSLPTGPAVPTGPADPGGPLPSGLNKAAENYEPDPDSEMAMKLDEHPTWIEIAHFPSVNISRTVSDGLQSLGIPCVVIPGTSAGLTHVSAFVVNSGPIAADILLVPEEFVERADNEAAAILGEDYEQFKTPNS